MMKNEQLTKYNDQALIPGPNETEKDFVQRAEYCLHLNQYLKDHIEEAIDTPTELTEPYTETKIIYDTSQIA